MPDFNKTWNVFTKYIKTVECEMPWKSVDLFLSVNVQTEDGQAVTFKLPDGFLVTSRCDTGKRSKIPRKCSEMMIQGNGDENTT
jgi:hypothetical protein